jgi:TetR/AcrR family transcriptional regulator of autoinduction and epiphytic fitness
MSASAGVPSDVDGRRLRREQNRQAVLDALVALFEEGHYSPSVAEIAARAGLSPRSLFRYFDDVDDLNSAAIDRQLAAARPLLEVDIDPSAPIAEKAPALVAARGRLFEAVAPAARAARACAHHRPVVARQLHESRRYHRREIERVFAPELARAGAALVPAIDALCSFETWELVRHEHGASVADAEASIAAALLALLIPPGGPR